MSTPLAERLRPKTLDDYLSQRHLVGDKGILSAQLKSGVLPSLILWGPPGSGKTTLAQLLAENSQRPFYSLSAINSGVKDVRDVIEKAKQAGGLFTSKNPVLFIDEIHRFSKSQQDSLLAAVERGWVTLIGATTENPSFEVIPALLSRCQVYILEPLLREDLEMLLRRAMETDIILSKKDIVLKETEALLRYSGGDARKLLNLFELLCHSTSGTPVVIENSLVESQLQHHAARYDKTGELHYDIISAFIKSVRGSDPNAAVYWLARMLHGGEDIKFIARRLIILAAEDIGLANPTALVIANTTFQAVAIVGMPEARILLSECTVYLATSPKSNASYLAINRAMDLVDKTGDLPVPLPLRNAPTKLMEELGYGEDYQYAHDYPGHFSPQEFLPDAISGTTLYDPAKNARENANREFLLARWKEKYGY